MDMDLSKLQETVEDRRAWHAVVHRVGVGHDLLTEQQQFTHSTGIYGALTAHFIPSALENTWQAQNRPANNDFMRRLDKQVNKESISYY